MIGRFRVPLLDVAAGTFLGDVECVLRWRRIADILCSEEGEVDRDTRWAHLSSL